MLLKVCCFLQVICSRNAGILVLILEFKFITWSCLFPLWGQEWSPWFRMVWVFVRQLLVTFWAWAACLGQLGLSQIHLHIRNPKGIRCQNLLREHLCHLSHPRWHRSAVLMGTRGTHCLAENPGLALTSGVAGFRAQTMSSGLNFPPSWGSSTEIVKTSGDPRWPQSAPGFPLLWLGGGSISRLSVSSAPNPVRRESCLLSSSISRCHEVSLALRGSPAHC